MNKTNNNLIWGVDDLLFITHGQTREIHRILFTSSSVKGNIFTKGTVFNKIFERVRTNKSFDKNKSWNYFKNEAISLGITKYGKINLFAKCQLELFSSALIKTLKTEFCLNDEEILVFAQYLELKTVEISHSIDDIYGNFEKSKVFIKLKQLNQKLSIFVDKSNDFFELEIKGDPKSSANLEFLIRDKIGALLFFNDLAEILTAHTEILVKISFQLNKIENNQYFQLFEFWEKTNKK